MVVWKFGIKCFLNQLPKVLILIFISPERFEWGCCKSEINDVFFHPNLHVHHSFTLSLPPSAHKVLPYPASFIGFIENVMRTVRCERVAQLKISCFHECMCNWTPRCYMYQLPSALWHGLFFPSSFVTIGNGILRLGTGENEAPNSSRDEERVGKRFFDTKFNSSSNFSPYRLRF